jgi:uracil-DNA glycosylase
MTLDEAALETLGLAPMWVRRASPQAASAHETAHETARANVHSTVRADARAPNLAADLAPVADPTDFAATGQALPTHTGAQQSAEVSDAYDVAARQTQVAGASDALDAEVVAAFAAHPERPAARAASVTVHDAPKTVDDVPAAGEVAALDWEALEARVSTCERCRLCEKRTKTVFGVGDRQADWMLIGEAPGENEDKQGEPFVGQAGKLLDSMLRALDLARGRNVYIANVVKCRPPGNRNPEPDEVARCEPYLQRQVALVKPKLIVALGRVSAQNLLKTDASISSLRGRVHRYEDVPVVVTYHPAYLLRSLPDKAKAWVDLCLAQDTYRRALAEQAGP